VVRAFGNDSISRHIHALDVGGDAGHRVRERGAAGHVRDLGPERTSS
jgi:hypothetical protein